MAASDATKASVLDRLVGPASDGRIDALIVIEAGGPPLRLGAAPVEDVHVFETVPGTSGGRLAQTGTAAGRLCRFRWTSPAFDLPPRTVMASGRFFQSVAGLVGAAPDMGWLVLSASGWATALDLLRVHGPLPRFRGVAILAGAPMTGAPLAEFEAALEDVAVTLVDVAGERRTIAGAGGGGARRSLDALGARFLDLTCEAGLVAATLTCKTPLPEGVSVVALRDEDPVAIARPVALDAERHRFRVELELPRSLQFDTSVPAVALQLVTTVPGSSRVPAALPARRFINPAELLESGPAPDWRKPFGIVLFSHTRTDSALLVLESLKRQGALSEVELWMDGDQGQFEIKSRLDPAEARFAEFGVPVIRRHRGRLGFRKLVLHALHHMASTCDRFVVLEDDCFPTENAIAHFRTALDRHADDPRVLTVYGSHFGLPSETATCSRFQGWGWGTWSDRFLPVLQELAYLYSLPEPAYLAWVETVLTQEVLTAVDCTPPRLASDTLRRFFAWDETLCLLAALRGQVHAPTAIRCIYNFGVGRDSAHFDRIERFRAPPFNMITKDEVWEYFREPTSV